MDMTSNTSNSTAAASAPHNHQQEAVVVPSPTQKEQAARNNKPKVRAAQQAGSSGEPKPRPRQEAALSCPRCSSKNTKFCYYNNYNLDQPRHFCKNCRRYWTQGGTLRLVPIGGGCRRNKRASSPSSSSAASSTAATSAVMENTFKTRLMLTAASTMSIPRSPTTGLIPNDKLPTFTPMGSSSGLDVAMEEGFLPFAPLSLPDEQAPELAPRGSDTGFLPFAPLSWPDEQAPELAPGGSDMGFLPFVPPSLPGDQAPDLARGGGDMTPTFLDMLTGGYFDAGSSSWCYGSGLSMGSGSKAMDMSFLLPGMGTLATDPMQTLGELHWSSAEIDSYFNDDDGYAAAPAAGVEQQQQVVGDDQQQDDEANNKVNKGAEA